MAQLSAIEWTDATWNPVTGCTKVSPGCKLCYAERMAKRLQGPPYAVLARTGMNARAMKGERRMNPALR